MKFAHISPNDRRYGGGRQEAHFGDHQTYEISRRDIVVEIQYIQIRGGCFRLFVGEQFAQIAVLVVAGKEVIGGICKEK